MFAELFGKGLPNKVSLYIPCTVNVRETLEESTVKAWIDRSLRFLSESFGGATALSAQGSWVAQDGTLVIEQITIVYAYADKLTRVKLEAIKRFAVTLKRELGQEAVAVEINDKLFFV